MQRTVRGRKTPSADRFNDVTARLMEEQFWIGYRRGFNRFRYGKIFAGYDEVNPVTANAFTPRDIVSLEKIAGTMGYRFGSKGLSVTEAAEEYKVFMKEIEEPK
jgi:hypothetical protein